MNIEHIKAEQRRILAELKAGNRGARGGRTTSPDRDRMNDTERAYAGNLEMRRYAGEILWWAFEPMQFRLAGRCTYTPDFILLTADGEMVIHETKGFMEDDAAVKLRLFREQFWFLRLFVVKRRGRGWTIKERR